MDLIWASLDSITSPDGRPRFPMLGNVAKLVLVLPHSNAKEQRLFSMVKTAFRPNLKLDGTLSSILTVKLANPNPYNIRANLISLGHSKKSHNGVQ